MDWQVGDLRSQRDRERAIDGVSGVVHTAGWVSLGSDPSGESRVINVEATRSLLDLATVAGVERFVYTSTLWTVAAGTSEAPADEDSTWNLDCIRSPYCEPKHEAERLVLDRDGVRLRTCVLCPGLVIGPRDIRPTSTRVLLEMARTPVIVLPRGGIPVVDARVLAQAHVRALERAELGRRYVVAGPYLSYLELAALVTRIAGRPRKVVVIPDAAEGPMRWLAGLVDRCTGGRWANVSAGSVAGGFLRLHVSGARADAAFGLAHPPPSRSIYEAFDDSLRSGRTPWLGPLRRIVEEPGGSTATVDAASG